MKKSIIAASASAVALAAMPVMGVFATDYETTVVETITATVPDSCSIYTTDITGIVNPSVTPLASAATVTFGTVTAGQTKTLTGTPMTINCNGTVNNTWTLSAQGSGTGTTVDLMQGETAANTIATGTTMSGDTSYWAMKMSALTVDGNVASYSDTDSSEATKLSSDWFNVPTASTPVASGTGSNQITSNYEIYVSQTQTADTYTGKVTYTLANPQS